MDKKIKYCLTLAVIFTFAGTSIGQETKSFLSVQDILAGWQKNYGSLKSMKVSYSEEIISAEPSQRDPNITNRLVKWTYVERIEDGKKLRAKFSTASIRPSSAKGNFADINAVEEIAFDGIHQDRYFPAQKTGQVFAGLHQKNAGTINALKRYMLLDSYTEQLGLQSEDAVFNGTIKHALTDPNLAISVRPVLEEVAGQMCHVVDIELIKKDNTKQKISTIWVAHEKGMFPLKFQEYALDRVMHEIAVDQIGYAQTNAGSLWFPKKAFQIWNLPESLGVIKQEFNVLEFVPDFKADPNIFRLNFPNGTEVGDVEMGYNYTVGVKQN